ncbi:MAG: hypothetical protein NTW47_03410, partial [Proteobacteria bacterium]|nr:hypothetical protein [Pseudomonadota bacterium]
VVASAQVRTARLPANSVSESAAFRTTILVTGGAGYAGMNVVEALLARKDRVVLVDAGTLPAAVQKSLAPYGALV